MSKKILHSFIPIGTTTIVTEVRHQEVEKCPSLSELQEMVGGLIELVRVNYNGKECDMLVNEEGLLHDLPFNETATRFMRETYDGYGHIVGPALIFEGFKLP